MLQYFLLMALIPAFSHPGGGLRVKVARLVRLTLLLPLLAPALPGQEAAGFEVSGAVINTATGAPLAGASVVLRPGPGRAAMKAQTSRAAPPGTPRVQPPEPEPPQRALTDAAGHFAFSVKDAVYAQVMATKRGFRSQRGQGMDAATVSVSPGDTGKLTLELTPLGAIEGRVVNEDGEPVPGLIVAVVTTDVVDGQKTTRIGASKRTDDQGEYRLWDLAPGPVYLKLVGRAAFLTYPSAFPRFPLSDEAYGPVYYPSGATLAEARPVQVQPGETVRAEFTVAARPAYSIRGTLRNLPAGVTAEIRLLRRGEEMGNRVAVNRAGGTFEIADVTPGSYLAQAYARTQVSTGGSSQILYAEAPVTVEDASVTGVALALSAGVEVKGTLQLPPATPEARGRSVAQVTAWAVGAVELPLYEARQHRAIMDAQGNFKLENMLPGKYFLEVTGLQGYLSAAWSGSVNVLEDGLTVDSAPAELRLTVSPGGAHIDVEVEGAAADQTLTVVAAPARKAALAQPLYRTDPSSFTSATVAPGSYTIYAFPADWKVEFRNPAALAAYAGSGVTVTVAENSHEKVKVKLAGGAK
jgi:hypothetical protein